MDAIFKLYEGLTRLGPGSKETTLRALDLVRNKLPAALRIIDIGCGCGAQTLDLAKNIHGDITAVDIYQPFLDLLLKRTSQSQLKASISTLNQDMGQLNFPDSSFDLIWSEGAIYLMGVKKGLGLWKDFLTPNGFIAFTEISWFKEDPPTPLSSYWAEYYPQLKTISENIDLIKRIGYQVIDHFSLPYHTWWENYYLPLMDRMEQIQRQSNTSEEMLAVISETNEEIELFRKYFEWYGYEFYIIQNME